MSCKLQTNKQEQITGVLDQNGNKSKLFQQIFNTPTLTLSESIDAYKNIYSDKLKDKVKFQQVFPTQKPAPQITQELIDRLKQSGLSQDVFLLSTEEINNKLKELGVSEDVRKQVKDASEILNVFHGTSKDKEFKKFKETGKGIFVTTSTEEASDYALQNDSMKFGDYDHVSRTFKELNTASRVIPLKLLKQNVYTLTVGDLEFLNSSPNYGRLQRELHTKIKKQGFDVIDYGKGVYAVLTPDRLTSLITGETMFSKSLNNVGINLITNGFVVKEYPNNSKILDILIAKNTIEKVC